MSEKSAQKRKYILEKAREVFAEKGYKNVTMKDVVEACDISRGGLYLYFSSVEEIFIAVLSDETEEDDDVIAALGNDATAGDMLALFLKEQKKEILRKKNSLVIASYEYFANKDMPIQDNPLRKQFDAGVQIVETLIENGVRSGEFICADPYGCARNLMYVVEGLKVSAKTIGISEAAVDRELLYILEGLLPADN
ncbi:TetR/AcrR family transcriptional regulator [Butyrivibrio sp. JL13D10]|uniref:TetR/AcrR family transcriptional regulator n=1 Tax=Butyrivibrio sp. JL13D10 TaxID=3236815 RepID=UPI0038B676E3